MNTPLPFVTVKALFPFLFLFIQCSVWAQTEHKQIRITKDIALIQLSPNAYIHVTQTSMPTFGLVSSNGLIYINKGKAFLFDTPATLAQTKTLIQWVEKSLHVKFAGFVPNHWHNDCMGGMAYIKARKIPSYANQMTISIAKTNKLPLPDKGFRDSLMLMLGDKPIACYYLGSAHSADNIVAWIPAEKILFAGCMVKEMAATTKGNLSDADVKAWPLTIKKVMNKFASAKVVIPGHGVAGGLELLPHTIDVVTK